MSKGSAGSRLSAVELEIISLVVSGLHDREIAATLAISEEAVKTYLAAIFKKLGVSDRLGLVLFATLHKLPPHA